MRTEQVPRVRLSINHDLATESAHGLFLLWGTLFLIFHSHSTQISRQGSEAPSSEKPSLRALVGVGVYQDSYQNLSVSLPGLRFPEGRDHFLPHFSRSTGGTC